jgi:hypothetical protein
MKLMWMTKRTSSGVDEGVEGNMDEEGGDGDVD